MMVAPARPSCFKKIYLALLVFARERLGEDWSDTTKLPNFSALGQGNWAVLEEFALLVLAAIRRDPALQLEVDCNLALLEPPKRECICDRLSKAIPSVAPSADRPVAIGLVPSSPSPVASTGTVPGGKDDEKEVQRSPPSPFPSNGASLNLRRSSAAESPIDYRAEFQALECVFEAISGEADALRHQLVLSIPAVIDLPPRMPHTNLYRC